MRIEFYPMWLLASLLLMHCGSPANGPNSNSPTSTPPDNILYTPYSQLPNTYRNFDSPRAINRLASIENEHFRNVESGISRFYGTVWRQGAELDSTDSMGSRFSDYLVELGGPADSMHCTIYAVEALKAGMGEDWKDLEMAHRRIWKGREHAGWSLGYLLVRDWDWRAFLVLDSSSVEFSQCVSTFKRKKCYPVWKQPDIPLEAMYVRGEDDSLIAALLSENEFGWGFSHQGIHTWVTHFGDLKECNWLGGPGRKYEPFGIPLFKKTPLLHFDDYASHVIVFPPKNDS